MHKIINYKSLYLIILSFYCFVLSQFGYELWDTGYITSFSWRIINNEIVYSDFIYKGPPVTLYFHAFFMEVLPEVGQFYLIRILNYLFFGIQVFFVVSGFYNIYSIKSNKYAVMCICFIISLLNFPPYPWPTTDGLLFVSIAFYLASLKNSNYNLNLIAIALFSILSALTKQSYYPIPFFFIVWIYLNKGISKSLIYILYLVILSCFFIYLIITYSSLDFFLKQTTGETKLFHLFYAGFLVYFWYYKYKWIYYIGILILTILLYYLYRKKEKTPLKTILNYFGLSIFALAIILVLCKEILIASRLIFISLVLIVFYRFNFSIKSFRKYSTIFLFLGIAWCSAISLGYPYPILFSTGMILSFILLFEEDLFYLFKKTKLTLFMLTICLIGFSYTIYPYREEHITKLSYSLEDITPKLKFIKTTLSNQQKLIDLKKMIEKYNRNFIVAPNIPMAHYLFNTQSKLPADWLINSEINKSPKLFINLAKKSDNFIFLEKSFINGEKLMPPQREKFSFIADYIYRNFKKIEETEYFIIYNTQITDERIPEIN